MIQLDPDRFLNELGRLFEKAKAKDTVSLTLKTSEYRGFAHNLLFLTLILLCYTSLLTVVGGPASSQPQTKKIQEARSGTGA